jgi:hypothetical protein
MQYPETGRVNYLNRANIGLQVGHEGSPLESEFEGLQLGSFTQESLVRT